MLDNVRHHAEVASEALKDERKTARSNTDKRAKTRDELDFMPAALEVTETPASPLGRVIMLAICAFFVIAVGWASVGKMDIIAIAQGKIIPSERVKLIQPLEAGVIRAIHVRDGQQVKAGQVLIELDPTGSAADRDRLSQDLTSAEVEISHLSALLEPDPETAYFPPEDAPERMKAAHRSYLLSEWQQFQARRASLEGDVTRRKAELDTIAAGVDRVRRKLGKVRERWQSSEQLFKKGIMSRMKFSEYEEQLFESEGELEVERRRLAETRAALTSAEAQLKRDEAEFKRDIHARLAEARQRTSGIEQELLKAAERNRQQTLSSPTAGTVQQLAVHTVGGVVTPAQQLMQIIPAGATLEVEAMVLNKDIGFVREDQEAILKVESFPFTKYGVIDGTVRQVYKDAVERENLGLAYPARVTMARSTMTVDGKILNLTPGMAITVEIKTGKRRLIEYILAPLQRYQDESLREQ